MIAFSPGTVAGKSKLANAAFEWTPNSIDH